MQVAFYGSTTLSLEILKQLYSFHKEGKISLKYVVSQSSKPFGRNKELKDNPVVEFCKNENITFYTPNKLKDLFQNPAEDLGTDLSLVAAYGKILPTQVLNTAKYGFLNFHGSLLPKYRGAAPVQMIILNQDYKSAGITLIKMDEGMDTGDIIKNYELGITNEEILELSSGGLMASLAELAAEKLSEDFDYIFNPKSWKFEKQNNEAATYCYVSEMSKNNFQIDFGDSIKKAHGKIMAANPDPLAWIYIFLNKELTKVNLIKSALTESGFQGFVKRNELSFHYEKSNKKLYLELQEGFLEILEIQPIGKKVMLGSEFGNGYVK